MGVSLGQLQQLAVDVKATGVAETRRDLDRLGDDSTSGSGWAGKLAKGGALAFGALATASSAVAGFGLKMAADAETAAVAFDTLLGPAADAFMGDLRKFAAETPFEFPELRTAVSRLLAAGTAAEDVIPLMTTLGDATSAMGTGSEGINRAVTALNQMRQAGKITAENMMQLTEAGVPAWEALAEVMGTDVAGAQAAVSAGQAEVNDLFTGLETAAGPALGRVSGMMEAQAQTFSGMLSTLKDTASMGLGDMMTPAMEAIKGSLPELTATIGSSLEAIAPEMSGLMSGVVNLLADLLPQVTPLLGAVAVAMGDTFDELGPTLAQIGPPLLGLFRAILPVLPALARSFGALAVAALPFVELLTELLLLVPPDVLAGLLIGFLAFQKVTPILDGLSKSSLGFTTAMGPWGLAIAAIIALAPLIIQNWGPISEFFKRVWRGVTEAFGWVMTQGGALVGWFTELPGRIIGAVSRLPGQMMSLGSDIVTGIWNGLVGAGQWLWDKVWGWIKDVLPGPIKFALGISSPSKLMAQLGGFAAEGLALGMLDARPLVASAADALATAAQPDPPSLTLAGTSQANTAPLGPPGGTWGNGHGDDRPVEVTLMLDGRVLARQLVDPMRGELIAKADRTGVDLFGGRA